MKKNKIHILRYLHKFQQGKKPNIDIDKSFLDLVNKLDILKGVEHKFNKENYKQCMLSHLCWQ